VRRTAVIEQKIRGRMQDEPDTLSSLSRKTGIGVSQLSNFRLGAGLNLFNFVRLADGLGVEISAKDKPKEAAEN